MHQVACCMCIVERTSAIAELASNHGEILRICKRNKLVTKKASAASIGTAFTPPPFSKTFVNTLGKV